MKFYVPLFIIYLIAISNCNLYKQDSYIEYYVVESYLISGQPLPDVLLSTTDPSFEVYEFEDLAVSGASVIVELLKESEGSDPEYVITYSELEAGIYTPDEIVPVLPGRTYRLEIITSDETQITAYTITPGNFELLSEDDVSVVYQAEEQIELQLTQSFYPNRQSVYIFTTIAQDTSVENLTPPYFDFYDADANSTLDDFRITSSGVLNEGNFTVNDDSTITLNVPWLAIAFFGLNDIIVSTVDDNVFDFVTSQEAQLGGFVVSPGEISNLTYHIDNAIGIFGSFTTDTLRANILR